MKHAHLISFVLTLLAIPAIAFGQPPRTLSYQGVLTDTLGTPKPDGTYSFTFRLFESSSGGTAIWTEQKTLQVKRGLFSTLLGDQVVIGSAVRFDRPYWLGIQLTADPEMVPRIEMSSVGYSRHAEKADTAAYALSAPPQAFVDSARVAATIPDGVVTTNKLANNAVTSGKIASAQVVKSINTLKDDVTLAAGVNVTITPSGSTLTIAASGGGGGNVSGTGVASQVPFWTGTSNISGDNALVWDNTNKRLGIGLSSPLASLHVEANNAAVQGNSLSLTGISYGVFGRSESNMGWGVYGQASSLTGGTSGVYGTSQSTNGLGVFGQAFSTTGTNYGVYGRSASSSGIGVYGEATSTGVPTTFGVYGTSSSSTGRGVHGEAPSIGVEGLATSTTGYGVYGVAGSGSTSGIAVRGQAQSPTGTTYGLYGLSYSSSGTGAYGEAPSTTGTTYGVYGTSASSTGKGVYGEASSTTGFSYGVWGVSNSSIGAGVYGINPSATGGYGVIGNSAAPNGRGVAGTTSSTTGNNIGVAGQSAGSSGIGVFGNALSSTGTTYGVSGVSNSSSGTGLYGVAASTTGTTYGVYGENQSSSGTGVIGLASSTTGFNYGVRGSTPSPDGTAVDGWATSSTGANLGVWAHSSSFPSGRGLYASGGTAMYCNGNFYQLTGVFEAHPTSTIWTTNKPATVKLNGGQKVKLFAEEAAEVYFNDYGEGTLAGGRAHVSLDAEFLQTVTIDGGHPMKVFLQLEDDCKGVFVSNKTSTGFDVVELQGGKSSAKFSYRVVCKRKYYEDERLATEEEDIRFNTTMHERVWPEVVAEQQSEKQRIDTWEGQHRKQMEEERVDQQRRQAEEQRMSKERR